MNFSNENINLDLPKDDISHEEFFEVNRIESKNKELKFDTSKIYNETILTYLIDNLPNIKDKDTLNLSNLISLINLMNEKQIGNLEIFDRLIAYAENKLIENAKKYDSGLNINTFTKAEKEGFLNDLFEFFKIHTELGKVQLEILNIFLVHYIFNLNLNNFISTKLEEKGGFNDFMNNLYNLLWLISISIANISENSNKLNANGSSSLNTLNKSLCLETYDKNLENDLLLSDKAVNNLVTLLKFISKHLDFENSFALEMDQKIRLYKSLLYLKLEGIVLNENLENFVKKFKNFHLLNSQNHISESLMEKKFEDILKKFKMNYEKEKITDFCSADFFIKPNIIVEINGPDHYSFGALKGKDNLKKRALKIIGFKILNIGYKEFKNLNELENKIKNILKIDLKKIILDK